MKKTVLITGAAQGIGAATAIRLASDGYDIAVNCRDMEKMEIYGKSIVENCRSFGVTAECFAADVSNMKQCSKMVNEIIKTFGTLDYLVNNAGIVQDGFMLSMPEDNYDSVIAANQKSVFNMMKLAGGAMFSQRRGRIVNISSVVGIYGNAGQINYSASKAAVIGMTKSAAKELGRFGITVNAIAPGFIETPMTDVLNEEQRKAVLNRITLNRFGKPEEIAGLIAFLFSEEASYITGQVIEVSGGLVM